MTTSSSLIREYVIEHPRQKLTIRQIWRALQNNPDKVPVTETQVMNWCSDRMATPRDIDVPLQRVAKGTYLYDPDGQPTSGERRVFEEVGMDRDGRIVLQCTDGDFYIAKKI